MVDKIQYRQTSMICECKSITKYNKGGKKEMGKTAVIFPGQGAQYVGMSEVQCKYEYRIENDVAYRTYEY